MPALLRVLVIETEEATRNLILSTLPLKDCEVSFASSQGEALELIAKAAFTAVIHAADKSFDHTHEFVTRVKAIEPSTGVFVLQKPYDAEAAVRLITAGAFDVLAKPLDGRGFKRALFPFLLHKSQDSQAGELAREERRLFQFHGVIGKNPQMLEVCELTERSAKHLSSALITGETGTGKDVIARAIHEARGGAPDAFHYTSCAGSSDPGFLRDLLATCAQGPRRICTIYLDEVAELAQPAQQELLRLLQQRNSASWPAGLAILASTSRDLGANSPTPVLLPELHARLSALQIALPPLRERLDDIPLLCQHLLERMRDQDKKAALGVNRAALITLMRYRWPGNIRQLEHVLERACIMSDEEFLSPEDLPQIVRDSQSANGSDTALPAVPDSLEEVERLHIAHVLRKSDFNKVAASRMLGISRSTLYQKMAKYRLTDPTRQNQVSAHREGSPQAPVGIG
jgi:DNA-binding NtrC family response regulator